MESTIWTLSIETKLFRIVRDHRYKISERAKLFNARTSIHSRGHKFQISVQKNCWILSETSSSHSLKSSSFHTKLSVQQIQLVINFKSDTNHLWSISTDRKIEEKIGTKIVKYKTINNDFKKMWRICDIGANLTHCSWLYSTQ